MVRKDMKDWVLSQEEDRSVKFDVWDLGDIWTPPFVEGLSL